MDLKEVAAALGLTESIEALRPNWDASQRSLPAGELPFLSPGFAAQACREVGLSEEAGQAVAATCRRLAGSAPLQALAWHHHYCLYLASAGDDFDQTRDWPSLQSALQEDAATLYLIVLLSGVPALKAHNQAHSVPPEIVRHTLSDLVESVEHHRHHHGGRAPGLSPYEVAWFANFIRGDLYRLGRLQFQFSSFWPRLRAFRHEPSGTVLALSEEGVRYQSSGQVADEEASDGEGVWTARLVVSGDRIEGYPILPTGRALERQIQLPAREWRQVLAPGDPALNVHMPGGGPLAHHLCGESFRGAAEFFPRHFPERPFAALCCHSWLLDAQLERWLPVSSNLVRFQREVYLFPVHLSPEELLRSIFHGLPKDLSKAPRDTTLQRAVLDHLLAGRKLEPMAGGCFLLPEDLDWGSEIYRRQRLDWLTG